MRMIGAAAGAALFLSACSGGADTGGETDTASDESSPESAADATPSGSGAGGAVSLTPGQYEATFEFVEIEFDDSQVPEDMREFVNGMIDEMVGETRITTDCITEEEINEPRGEIFSGNEDASCQYDRFEIGGGTIDMAMSCSDPDSGGAQFEGTGTYTADSYSMTMRVEMGDSAMGAMRINARSNGRRVGECTAE